MTDVCNVEGELKLSLDCCCCCCLMLVPYRGCRRVTQSSWAERVVTERDLHLLIKVLNIESATQSPSISASPTIRSSTSPSLSRSASMIPTLISQTYKVSYASALGLAQTLAGPSVTILNATLTHEACTGVSHGLFQGGSIGLDDAEKGVVLTNGHITSPIDKLDGNCSSPGFDPLEELMVADGWIWDSWIPVDERTHDATVLEIAFECNSDTATWISVEYVFSSDEFKNPALDQYLENDAIGIFLNGEEPSDNIATISDQTAVSVYNVLLQDDDSIFIDGAGNGAIPGHTKPLIAKSRIDNKVNILTIAIADIIDDVIDSYLFIKGGSLLCNEASLSFSPAPTPYPTPVPTTAPSSAPTISLAPSSLPTSTPIPSQSPAPSFLPTSTPTLGPSLGPSLAPTSTVSISPSNNPTGPCKKAGKKCKHSPDCCKKCKFKKRKKGRKKMKGKCT
jgi:hypothetical protein